MHTISSPRVRAVAWRLLRMSVAFVLAFGTTLGAQSLYAHDALASSNLAIQADDEGEEDEEAVVGDEEEAEGQEEEAGGEEEQEEPEQEPEGEEEPEQEAEGEEEPGEEEQEEEQEEEAELHIIDVGVFLAGTNRDAYAYASEGQDSLDEPRATIEERGGQMDFDAAIIWDDGSDWEYDSDKVSWSIADGDEEIARISPAGILEAAGTDDGTVTVTARVDGSYTADGADLEASFKVELVGQTDTRFVKHIVICDDAGEPIDPAYRFEAGTLSTAMLELSARVTVHDPADDTDEEILVTPSDGLSSQTDGQLADLVWEVADTRLGTVSEEGIYRPAIAATNIVYAASTAGFNGNRVTAQATIDMPPDAGKEAPNGYHPQSSLTVKVYYEDYPDQQVGKDVTFSISDLEELGCIVATYTALKGKEGYLTTTGRGPLLVDVLKAAGVNTDGIARLRFGTPDNYQGVVSWDMLVDTDRYYFPNIDIASYSEAVQVAPMIAIDSYRNVGSDVSVHAEDMTDTRRFLLLFGAKDTGETTTNLQVYNIHTLYVELEGSPPSKFVSKVNVKFVDSLTGKVLKSESTADPDSVSAPDAPSHDGYTFKGWSKSVDKKGNITYTTAYEEKTAEKDDKSSDSEDDNAGESKDGDKPSGSAPSNNNGGSQGGTHDLVDANKGNAAQSSGAQSANGTAGDAAQESTLPTDAAITQLDPSQVTELTPGRWSVLQAINRHPSNIEDLMLDNPLAPFTAPFLAGAFAAGGLEAGISFIRQRRLPKFLKRP